MWGLTDLNAAEYALDWYVRVNDDYVLYEHQTEGGSLRLGDLSWSFSIDNSTTCKSRSATGCGSTPGTSPDWMDMKEDSFWWYELRPGVIPRTATPAGSGTDRLGGGAGLCPRARPTSRCTSRT